jgi:hypothetical protein
MMKSPDLAKNTICMRTLGKLLIFSLLLMLASGCGHLETTKATIGKTARIKITEANLEYLARIDTGARITSVHALNIVVQDGETDKTKNIGKSISFDTANEKGESKQIFTKIVDVGEVRNAQGIEYRYVVDLKLNWNGVNRSGLVNLRDRSAMSYKLLIGRNWLGEDFKVDVSKNEGVIK